MHREDHESHGALLCVQTGSMLSDPKRFKFEGAEHYLKSASEMRYLFRDFPEACDNTLWVAERADVNIEFGSPLLPNFPIPAYRNTTLLQALLQTLQGNTRLALSCGLTLATGWSRSAQASSWKKINPATALDLPTVFCIGR